MSICLYVNMLDISIILKSFSGFSIRRLNILKCILLITSGLFMKKGKIVFTGSFGDYFIASLGLLLLSVITLGVMFPYFCYWMFKYFFTRLYDSN